MGFLPHYVGTAEGRSVTVVGGVKGRGDTHGDKNANHLSSISPHSFRFFRREGSLLSQHSQTTLNSHYSTRDQIRPNKPFSRNIYTLTYRRTVMTGILSDKEGITGKRRRRSGRILPWSHARGGTLYCSWRPRDVSPPNSHYSDTDYLMPYLNTSRNSRT